MKRLTYLAAFTVVLSWASFAAAVDIEFDLPSGMLVSDGDPLVFPPDMYHSNPIAFDPLLIKPGESMGVWVKFKDMLHLEVIDGPIGNTDGVERLRTHVRGQVVPDAAGNDHSELWVDVILTGTTGHIREVFDDPNSDHSTRLPLNTGDDPDAPPVDRGDPTGQTRNDDLIGDWDGADDNSGTDLWDLFHEDVVVDKELHAVNNGFLLETWADDLTDDRYLYHDIHWEITNHGPNAVEIFDVEFWQDGNIVRIGQWVPEPSSITLAVVGLLGLLASKWARPFGIAG